MTPERSDNRTPLDLASSEKAVFRGACAIYAALLAAGKVDEADRTAAMDRAVDDAIHLALRTDAAIASDDETKHRLNLRRP